MYRHRATDSSSRRIAGLPVPNEILQPVQDCVARWWQNLLMFKKEQDEPRSCRYEQLTFLLRDGYLARAHSFVQTWPGLVHAYIGDTLVNSASNPAAYGSPHLPISRPILTACPPGSQPLVDQPETSTMAWTASCLTTGVNNVWREISSTSARHFWYVSLSTRFE